jgi:hypothetical protein
VEHPQKRAKRSFFINVTTFCLGRVAGTPRGALLGGQQDNLSAPKGCATSAKMGIEMGLFKWRVWDVEIGT